MMELKLRLTRDKRGMGIHAERHVAMFDIHLHSFTALDILELREINTAA